MDKALLDLAASRQEDKALADAQESEDIENQVAIDNIDAAESDGQAEAEGNASYHFLPVLHFTDGNLDFSDDKIGLTLEHIADAMHEKVSSAKDKQREQYSLFDTLRRHGIWQYLMTEPFRQAFVILSAQGYGPAAAIDKLLFDVMYDKTQLPVDCETAIVRFSALCRPLDRRQIKAYVLGFVSKLNPSSKRFPAKYADLWERHRMAYLDSLKYKALLADPIVQCERLQQQADRIEKALDRLDVYEKASNITEITQSRVALIREHTLILKQIATLTRI